MQKKKLGRSGVEVGIVGLGAAFIGVSRVDLAPKVYSGQPQHMDLELGARAVHAALEAGGTLVDTAPLYGDFRSEELIGRALRQRPDLAAGCIVTTKVGRIYAGYDFSSDAVLRSVEESQRRLGLERFAVLYIHDPMGWPMEQILGKDRALGALRRLQDQGIVKAVGIAANEPATNALYIETGEFDAAVVPEAWSLLNQKGLERILPAAERHNVGLVIATPLERGLLATGPQPGIDYLARRFSPRVLERVARIQALCREYQVPLAAAALQWCTRHPQVAATVPGARTPEEARENTLAGQVVIPEGFWQDLEPLVQHWESGVDR
ncbi:MAG: aldo/keto reductase [Candidatus Handelsmanbacteria bacterium]|nr:aldo/keto reductase [Candidatus Handelsmanbacteria bacterium]